MQTQYFSANGKLLLTGEYFVLDGAEALAVPTKLGQTMTIQKELTNENLFSWRSFDSDGSCWFEGQFSKKDFKIITSDDSAVANRLVEILKTATHLNPDFHDIVDQLSMVKTTLDFPRQWGLGTSSTLIAMIAKWAKINPYELLAKTFGGSGYDLACADADQALLYQLPGPVIKSVPFSPIFSDQIYFVYLNQKQNSREGIQRYRKIQKQLSKEILEINRLTEEMLHCKTQNEFAKIMVAHEALVSSTLKIERVKELYFSDFPGEVKSLGAWGGDFVMVTSKRPMEWVQDYFAKKGKNIFKTYEFLIKERK